MSIEEGKLTIRVARNGLLLSETEDRIRQHLNEGKFLSLYLVLQNNVTPHFLLTFMFEPGLCDRGWCGNNV